MVTSDRVPRGAIDESRTDIRCRGKEESDRIISETMDKTYSIGLIIFSMKEG